METQTDPSKTVVLNMDETSLQSPTKRRFGNCPTLPNACKIGRPAMPRTTPKRCSLVALICNLPRLQGHLPQVILPRSFGKSPSPKAQRMYASMGSPLEAWHLTSGFNDVHSMMQWLRRIHTKIRQFDPYLQIVLVFDAYTIHIADAVLQLCKRLGIRVIIVPARLTWLLQPLDAMVFQHFKRLLRDKVVAATLAAPQGGIPWPKHMSIVGECVHTTFVQSSWATEMDKMGLATNHKLVRQRLQTLLCNIDVDPRPPTEEEAARLIGRRRRQDKSSWATLLQLHSRTLSAKRRVTAIDVPECAHGHDAGPVTTASSSTAAPAPPSMAVPRASRIFGARPRRSETSLMMSAETREPALNVEVHRTLEPRRGPSAGTRAYSAHFDSQGSATGTNA